MMKDEWRMNVEWWKMKVVWWKMKDLSCWGVLLPDGQTNERTNGRTFVNVESLSRLKIWIYQNYFDNPLHVKGLRKQFSYLESFKGLNGFLVESLKLYSFFSSFYLISRSFLIILILQLSLSINPVLKCNKLWSLFIQALTFY